MEKQITWTEKYRPQILSDVEGNDKAKAELRARARAIALVVLPTPGGPERIAALIFGGVFVFPVFVRNQLKVEAEQPRNCFWYIVTEVEYSRIIYFISIYRYST